LISFARRYGVSYDEKILINKKLSIDYITNLLGVNRATTVRAIRKLKDMNLLENINGFYCIRGIQTLKSHQEILSCEVSDSQHATAPRISDTALCRKVHRYIRSAKCSFSMYISYKNKTEKLDKMLKTQAQMRLHMHMNLLLEKQDR